MHNHILTIKVILDVFFFNYFFIPGPAGVCSLSVSHVNGTSATVSWEPATGHFDFYRVAVSNSSHIWTLDVSPHSQEVTVSSLWNGCSYNITVQRFRNIISGNAATVTIHTGLTVTHNTLCTTEGTSSCKTVLKLFVLSIKAWIEPNWINLNWTELILTALNWTKPNWIELNCIAPNWTLTKIQ